MQLSKKVKITSLVIGMLVIFNAYLLLKDNEIILKKYYINDAHFAVAKDHEKILSTDAVVTSSIEHYIAAPVQAVNEVLVTEGQTVELLSELIVFKEEEKDKEMARLEAEKAAYETERAELENVITQLDIMETETYPTSAVDTSSVGDDESWSVNLSVELGIDQGTPIAEGIAIVQRAMAETSRQIEVLDSRIAQLMEHNVLTSPIDGIVKDIVLEGDSIIFNIQSSDKKVVVYATPKQWQQLALDQFAEITLFKGQDNEWTFEGTVIEKQQIPVRESIAFEEMKKHEKVNPDDTVYEVSIAPAEDLFEIPVGALAKANITVDEEANSLGVHEEWLVEVENDPSKYIYVLDATAKTTLLPVEKRFTYKTHLNEHEALATKSKNHDEVVEPEPITEPRIQTVTLKKEKNADDKKQEQDKVAVVLGVDNVYPIVLDETQRNLFAPTFRPYPIRTFDRDQIDTDWRLILEYWLK